MNGEIPETLIIGTQRDSWVLHVFQHEAHATSWVADNLDVRRLYRCRVTVEHELTYVPPGQASLARKGDAN